MQVTAIIYPDELPDGEPMLTAHCPELDVTTQGETRNEALANLKEAVELFLEVANDAEVGRRLRSEHQGAIAAALEVAAWCPNFARFRAPRLAPFSKRRALFWCVRKAVT